MKRDIDQQLLDWKHDSARRALLVRGARQVGKTYSVRELGRTFAHYLEVNFEEHPDVCLFFRDSPDPIRLREKLAAYYSTPIVPGETLLFLDEIQSCPEAFSSLRFLYEKMSDLHVVAAGSLLELAVAEIPSLGVGRLTSLHMYPLTFREYLAAMGEEALSHIVDGADPDHPLDEPFHRRLVEHVKGYQLVGGMPAVVNAYAQKRDLAACFRIQDDFAKYKKRAPMARLAEVFRSVVLQSGAKFKYSSVGSGSSLHLLVQAGLVYRVVHTQARGIPLGAQVDVTKFKAVLFDVGIHQRLLGLDVPEYLTSSDLELVTPGRRSTTGTGKHEAAMPIAPLAHRHTHRFCPARRGLPISFEFAARLGTYLRERFLDCGEGSPRRRQP
jgi:hypothetical protein